MTNRRVDERPEETPDPDASGREPVIVAWSGGKDCTLALAELLESAEFRPVRLLTTVTEVFDRISMHGVRSALLRTQAEALGLPLEIVPIPPETSNEVYRQRMAAAMQAARNQGIRTIAFGDLLLEDVRAYREAMLAEVGMGAIFPLWGRPTHTVAHHFIRAGYQAITTCVDTQQLSGEFAGRSLDQTLLEDLPAEVDPCGENGEFHSFVYDGPIFRRAVRFRVGDRVLRDDRFMYCDLHLHSSTLSAADVREG